MSPMTERATARKAFEQALSLLNQQRPDLAVRQLREILKEHHDEVNSLRLLGSIRLAQGDAQQAVEHLSRAVDKAPKFTQATLDLGRAYRASGRLQEAADMLQSLCRREPSNDQAWQLHGDVLTEQGHLKTGRQAFRRAAQADPLHKHVAAAVEHIRCNRKKEAEAIFRDILKQNPNHIHALVGLANIALDAGVTKDAERLLQAAQALSPNIDTLWRGLSRLHSERAEYEAAEAAAQRAVALAPDTADCWTMLGTVQAWGLRPEQAKQSFEQSLALKAEQPRVVLSLGHVLKTIGDRANCELAYQRAASMDSSLGEAYWSLADLKNYAFNNDEIVAMQTALRQRKLAPTERAAFHFALGKALEGQADYDGAFEHYAAGNSVKRKLEGFNSANFSAKRRRIEVLLTGQFMRERRASSPHRTTPIFVVGLPRSGSTLIEQILASHSDVQGTMELPHILNYVREFNADDGYPECLASFSRQDFNALGERYLAETATYRGEARWFVDKMPNNFAHLGLIHAMLPQALFIDARRQPMACCFSIFKQNFARGQSFSYDLETLGRYYQDYLAFMRHWGQALPGRMLHLLYEDLVDATEMQIRRLLDHCGLPFEQACLNFHQTQRAVRTASAEQVRRPIYRQSIDSWRKFERHLKPLEQSLGSALSDYVL